MQMEVATGRERLKSHRGSQRIVRRRVPGAWHETLRLADGRELLVRPISPNDAAGLQASFMQMSPEEIRFRFQHPMSELTDEMAARLAGVRAPDEFALVAIEQGVDSPRIGAVVRASVAERTSPDDPHEAEFALTVGSPLANHGLGTLLLRSALRWARLKRLDALYGDISHDNAGMLRVVEKLGFQRIPLHDNPGLIRARISLNPAALVIRPGPAAA